MYALLYLLKSRRFLPLLITQFLGAFNDNAFKFAALTFITFHLIQDVLHNQMIQVLAASLFTLPFFLFSATAGQLADKYSKSFLIKIIKTIEAGIMGIGAYALLSHHTSLMILTIFLMGTHSAFFGPLKYAILPEQLKTQELLGANAWVEATTFIAILVGTILGTLSIPKTTQFLEPGLIFAALLVILAAIIGMLGSWFIPRTQPTQPRLRVNFNFLTSTYTILRESRKNKTVFLAILGISWFWFVGASFVTEFPIYVQYVFGADSHVFSLFLALFSIGIASGALINNRLLKGQVSAKYVPLGILGMTLFIIDLFFQSPQTLHGIGHLIGIDTFITRGHHFRVLFDLFMMAVCGGIYIVPLYTLLQTESKAESRAQTIAANNLWNSCLMVFSALFVGGLSLLHFTVPAIFLSIGILNGAVALYFCQLLPPALIKAFIKRVLHLLYRAEIQGLEHYHEARGRMLIVANHTSFLDVLLLSVFLPDRLTIAIDAPLIKKWWIKPFIALVDAFPIDPASPMSTKAIIQILARCEKCVIFPEGPLTATSSLKKVYEATGTIIDKSGAVLLPIQIDGALFSPFSRMRDKVRTQLFPKIRLTVLPPYTIEVSHDLDKRARRRFIAAKLYTLMTGMVFKSSPYKKTLFEALIHTEKTRGRGYKIVEDIQRAPLTYRQFIMRSFILGGQIAKQTRSKEYVGIMLPTSIAGSLTFFAMQLYGRVPAMLNFSIGWANIVSTCKTACIQTVYTSRLFVENAKLENILPHLKEAGLTLIYLEDLKNSISPFAKGIGILLSLYPKLAYRMTAPLLKSTDPGVVLFTSGSEGIPKGVVLSHENLLANCYQVAARIDFNTRDKIFTALPIFHCLGLTIGTIFPLTLGIRTFFYPSPLHYRVVPQLIYETNASVFFSTDTFLSGYARLAQRADFQSIRYIFAGAEKVKEDTIQIWATEFGVPVFEGYGATESAPVISINTVMQNKPGSVGRFLPAIDYRLDPVEGLSQGGRLHVRGPNVMMGYLLPETPGIIMHLEDRWHDTGDIGRVDPEGFLFLLGRAKRFAKIGGEMVSLSAVESYVSHIWPGFQHAILTLPDPKKGEQLILLTNYPKASREALVEAVKQNGITELWLPKAIRFLAEFPILATGKTDYVALQKVLA